MILQSNTGELFIPQDYCSLCFGNPYNNRSMSLLKPIKPDGSKTNYFKVLELISNSKSHLVTFNEVIDYIWGTEYIDYNGKKVINHHYLPQTISDLKYYGLIYTIDPNSRPVHYGLTDFGEVYVRLVLDKDFKYFTKFDSVNVGNYLYTLTINEFTAKVGNDGKYPIITDMVYCDLIESIETKIHEMGYKSMVFTRDEVNIKFGGKFYEHKMNPSINLKNILSYYK